MPEVHIPLKFDIFTVLPFDVIISKISDNIRTFLGDNRTGFLPVKSKELTPSYCKKAGDDVPNDVI